MVVSNKKKKSIVRAYPEKSVPVLARELGLSERQVKAVLRSEGRLPARSPKIPLALAGVVVAVGVVALGLYALFLGPGAAELRRLAGDLNVLVVTIDTLRADRLGCYGYGGARTPVIDSIAASGVRFENAYCLQPVTLPSHATIFTGTHPARHGVADNGNFMLPGEAVTVAEALKGEGISTGAVVASFVLHRQFGLDQGFDTYDDGLLAGRKRDSGGYDEIGAAAVSDRALEWIGQNAEKRWFLWLHYYDPHADYEPPPSFARTGFHPYDGEVAYVDFELGRVVDELERRGLRERTLLIVTADHGESLGEHGELTHGLFLYEAAMRVPLIVSLPGTIPAGRVVSRSVSLMDVAPTVLSSVGVSLPDEVQGRSLIDLLFSDAADVEEVPVIMETRLPWHSYGWSPSSAIVAENFKLIEAPKPELYDLGSDPLELTNLYDENRRRAADMRKRSQALRAGYSEYSLEGASSVEMDDETRDRLASLGYVSTGSTSAEPGEDAPDAKDMVEVMNMAKRASVLRDEGSEDEAIALLESAIDRSPDSRMMLNQLGNWYAERKDLQSAEQVFKRLIQLDPEFIDAYRNLGQAYFESSRLEEAAIMAQTVLSKFPRSARAHGLMGIIRLQEKDYQGALEYLNKAIEYYPSYHESLSNRSVAYYYLGDYEKALQDLKTASRIMPENERYALYVKQLEEEMRSR